MWQDVVFDFHNHSYVVVGASSGMGKDITLNLAQAGANVLAIARSEERLGKLRKMFPEKIKTATIDVLTATNKDWENVLDEYVKEVGKCSGGVYTAGVGGITSLRGFDAEAAHKITDTSFYGMIGFLSNLIKKKYVRHGSSFAVFSSVAAYEGQKGGIAYTAAKSAVKNSVKSIAKEICRDMHRINSISPGWVKSELTENAIIKNETASYEAMLALHRLGTGEPKDVSGMVLFLLSDAARWITGADFVVDGGYLLGID